jgi:porphobilinogen synthase
MLQTQPHTTLKLTRRLRRLRTSQTLRALVRETRLSPEMFILPLFVCEGEGVRREVASMLGVFNLSVDEAVKEAEAAKSDGVTSVMLFGLPDRKDNIGSAAYDPEAPVQTAISAIKRALPDVLVVTDVCLCEYTDHGHCGIAIDSEIENDDVDSSRGRRHHHHVLRARSGAGDSMTRLNTGRTIRVTF